MHGENYRDQYSEQAIQIVRKKYEREIEFFGYEFQIFIEKFQFNRLLYNFI